MLKSATPLTGMTKEPSRQTPQTKPVHPPSIRPDHATHPNEAGTTTRTGHMALTFGTLLSSQGTDAHRPRPLSRSRGNSPSLTTLCPVRQPPLWSRPGRPSTATRPCWCGRGGPSGPSASACWCPVPRGRRRTVRALGPGVKRPEPPHGLPGLARHCPGDQPAPSAAGTWTSSSSSGPCRPRARP